MLNAGVYIQASMRSYSFVDICNNRCAYIKRRVCRVCKSRGHLNGNMPPPHFKMDIHIARLYMRIGNICIHPHLFNTSLHSSTHARPCLLVCIHTHCVITCTHKLEYGGIHCLHTRSPTLTDNFWPARLLIDGASTGAYTLMTGWISRSCW